jgi:biuret amidohydrolase
MPYRLDHIDSAETVMIVVDMQNDFVSPGAPMQSTQALDLVEELANTLDLCRASGIRVVYTAQVHRIDGSDTGLFGDLYPSIQQRSALMASADGAQIIDRLFPRPGEHVIEKRRYSAFFATDLDLILRGWGIKTVVISGTTTENCCHATARDALFLDYKVAFLSDLTGTIDYPDLGYGALSAAQVHRTTLSVLAFSTAHVMSKAEFSSLIRTN